MPKPIGPTVKSQRVFRVVLLAIAAIMVAIGLVLDGCGVLPFTHFMLLIPIVGLVCLPVFIGIGCIWRSFFPSNHGYETVFARLGPMLTFLLSISIASLGVALYILIFVILKL